MRNLLFVLIIVLAATLFTTLAVAATSSDETTVSISIIGASFSDTPKETTIVEVDTSGLSLKGRVARVTDENWKSDFRDAGYVVAKGTGVQLSRVAEITLWELEPNSSFIGVTAFKKGDQHLPPRTFKDVLVPGLDAGEIAEITWTVESKPTPATEIIETTTIIWEPPSPLNDGRIVLIVSGRDGYWTWSERDGQIPAFPGDSIVVTSQRGLRGFEACWMFLEPTLGRNPADNPGDAGPAMSYDFGLWTPWVDPASLYFASTAVWLGCFWPNNNLAIEAVRGPQLRLKAGEPTDQDLMHVSATRDIVRGGQNSFAAMWVGDDWMWLEYSDALMILSAPPPH